MQVAAAEAAAGGPANGKQQQWGQQQQGANPRMIPIIDLSQGEEAWLQSQQQAAAQAATAGAQQPRGGAPQQQPLQQQAQRGGGSRAGASQLAAATLGASAGLEGMLSAAPSEDVELAEWPSGAREVVLALSSYDSGFHWATSRFDCLQVACGHGGPSGLRPVAGAAGCF